MSDKPTDLHNKNRRRAVLACVGLLTVFVAGGLIVAVLERVRDFRIALADGSVRFLSRNISETSLRVAITRNGGDTLGPDW